MKFKVGDKVVINGGLYVSSNANSPVSYVKNKVTTITRVAQGTKHPYNTTGDLGWMNESDIKLYEEPQKIYECEIELTDNNGLIDYLKNHTGKIVMINSEDLKKVLGL
jgi:hypothetical protein